MQKKKLKTEKIQQVKLKNYKEKFKKVQAFQALENTTMRLDNGDKYFLNEGDFFVMLDLVNCVVIKEHIFKKLFLLKENEEYHQKRRSHRIHNS